MKPLPKDLTADALFRWQDDLEADLERVLLGHTERALSSVVELAVKHDLTSAGARAVWERAVTDTLKELGLENDRFLAADLMDTGIGDEAYNTVQTVLGLAAGRMEPVSVDELREALAEALDLGTPSLTASGATEEFWSDENWIEQTGTGHLPRYIRAIADELMKRGYGESRAIATAVNTVKRWARKGPARHGGKGHVSAKTQAKAIAALVEWEAKRAEARATALTDPEAFELGDEEIQLLSLVASGKEKSGWLSKLLHPAKSIGSKWRTRVRRQVRTGFTGVLGRMVLAELRSRGIRTKTWVSKRDEKVRTTHRIADGQTVPVDQPFRVGATDLQYPGERGKPLQETANCRCIIVPGTT